MVLSRAIHYLDVVLTQIYASHESLVIKLLLRHEIFQAAVTSDTTVSMELLVQDLIVNSLMAHELSLGQFGIS